MHCGWNVSDADPATNTYPIAYDIAKSDSDADAVPKSDVVAESESESDTDAGYHGDADCDDDANLPDVNHAIDQPDHHRWHLGLVQRRQPELLPR